MGIDPASQEGLSVLLSELLAGVALVGGCTRAEGRMEAFVLQASRLQRTHMLVLGSPLPFSLLIVTPQAGVRMLCRQNQVLLTERPQDYQSQTLSCFSIAQRLGEAGCSPHLWA